MCVDFLFDYGTLVLFNLAFAANPTPLVLLVIMFLVTCCSVLGFCSLLACVEVHRCVLCDLQKLKKIVHVNTQI